VSASASRAGCSSDEKSAKPSLAASEWRLRPLSQSQWQLRSVLEMALQLRSVSQ
jgi:hypothetical protein